MLIWCSFDVYSHLMTSYSQQYSRGLHRPVRGPLNAFRDPFLTSPSARDAPGMWELLYHMYGPDQSKNCGSSPSSWSYLSPRRSYSGQQPIWVAHRQANATLPRSKGGRVAGFKALVPSVRTFGWATSDLGVCRPPKVKVSHADMPARSGAGRLAVAARGPGVSPGRGAGTPAPRVTKHCSILGGWTAWHSLS